MILKTVKKIAKCLIFCIALNAFSQEQNDEPLKKLSDICFSVVQKSTKGFSNDESLSALVEVSSHCVKLLTSTVWTREGNLYLIELANPSCIGVLDCTILKDDILPQKEQVHPDWVETIVYALAKDGQDFEYDFDVDVLSLLDGKSEHGIEEEIIEEETEKSFWSKDNSLRHFLYGKEHLTKSKKGENIILTDEADGLVRRKTFNSDNKIILYEEFRLGIKAKEAKKNLERTYLYSEDGKLSQTVQNDIISLKKLVVDYDEKLRGIRKVSSHFKDEQEFIDEDIKIEYDENDNEILIDGIKFYWSQDKNAKDISQKTTYQKHYDYSKFANYPDYLYYENSKLRMSTVYNAENVYNEKMYFDDGFSVETFYEDGFKTLEIIFLNGKEQRRTAFER